MLTEEGLPVAKEVLTLVYVTLVYVLSKKKASQFTAQTKEGKAIIRYA